MNADPNLNTQPSASRRFSNLARILLGLGILIALGLAVAYRIKDVADTKFRERLHALALRPDGFSQMCRSSPFVLMTYGIDRDGPAFSIKSYEWLRENRKLSISTIRPLMNQAFQLMVQEKQEDEAPLDPDMEVAQHMDIVSEFVSYLAMLIDLNAHEALPDLLEYEMRLRPMVKLPDHEDRYGSNFTIESTMWMPKWTYAYLMSAILAILYQEQVEAVIDSEINLKFAHRLSPSEIRRRDASNLFALVLTEDRRDQIIRWADDFLLNVPESKRLGPKGMIPEPIVR